MLAPLARCVEARHQVPCLRGQRSGFSAATNGLVAYLSLHGRLHRRIFFVTLTNSTITRRRTHSLPAWDPISFPHHTVPARSRQGPWRRRTSTNKVKWKIQGAPRYSALRNVCQSAEGAKRAKKIEKNRKMQKMQSDCVFCRSSSHSTFKICWEAEYASR